MLLGASGPLPPRERRRPSWKTFPLHGGREAAGGKRRHPVGCLPVDKAYSGDNSQLRWPSDEWRWKSGSPARLLAGALRSARGSISAEFATEAGESQRKRRAQRRRCLAETTSRERRAGKGAEAIGEADPGPAAAGAEVGQTSSNPGKGEPADAIGKLSGRRPHHRLPELLRKGRRAEERGRKPQGREWLKDITGSGKEKAAQVVETAKAERSGCGNPWRRELEHARRTRRQAS